MSMPAEHLTSKPTLDTLLEGYADAAAIHIDGIAVDSRRLDRGFLFLACEGATQHGLDYCHEAVQSGVAAIAYDCSSAKTVPDDIDVPLIPIANLRSHLGEIANRYFGSPSQELKVIAVTGTNGKSTVAWMIAHCLQSLGRSCAYSGTLGSGVGNVINNDEMTSPDVIETHRRIAEFRDAGARYAAIEVSSHALDQHRVDGVEFDATLFTNLSQDHLDYHGDMRAYGEAKAKLFCEHTARRRIINTDSGFGTQLAERCGKDIVLVSTRPDRVANGRSHVFVSSAIANRNGSQVSLQSSWGPASFALPLLGDFNVANAVIVLALLLVEGVELRDACNALSTVVAPRGRMQRVRSGSGPAVYVDYAHSPSALENALQSIRTHCRGEIWCVFGCGGDRDVGKRPKMGRLAERFADNVVVTNDNPRNEASDAIIADILVGFEDPANATVINDRGAAIAWAIANARSTDIVLLAGKGHEEYQLIAGERFAFSDYDVALANLDALAAERDA